MDITYEGIRLTPSEIVAEYVQLIESLSAAARRVWDQASRRDFDFGYESGSTPNNFHSRVEAEQVRQLAAVGGSVVITIYPIDAYTGVKSDLESSDK